MWCRWCCGEQGNEVDIRPCPAVCRLPSAAVEPPPAYPHLYRLLPLPHTLSHSPHCTRTAPCTAPPQAIFKKTPHDKQVMMFSATLSSDIRPVCKKFMRDVSQRPPTTMRAAAAAA